ncbi:MAG: four helix bundle protein [Longimicrobiales bacterium]
MARFDHERLDVYQVSIRLVVAVHRLTARAPRGWSEIKSQARRAAISISLNIAEASGEFSPKEKRRFIRIARRSATECVAALDIMKALGIVSDEDLEVPRELLDRIVAMLTNMSKPKRGSHAPPPAHATGNLRGTE